MLLMLLLHRCRERSPEEVFVFQRVVEKRQVAAADAAGNVLDRLFRGRRRQVAPEVGFRRTDARVDVVDVVVDVTISINVVIVFGIIAI